MQRLPIAIHIHPRLPRPIRRNIKLIIDPLLHISIPPQILGHLDNLRNRLHPSDLLLLELDPEPVVDPRVRDFDLPVFSVVPLHRVDEVAECVEIDTGLVWRVEVGGRGDEDEAWRAGFEEPADFGAD